MIVDAPPLPAPGMLRLPPRVLFGRRAVEALGAEMAVLGGEILVCTDANIARTGGFARALRSLRHAGVRANVFDATSPDLPPASLAACLDVASQGPVDAVLGIGGGSALDMAKVAALLLAHGGPLERYYGDNAVPGPVLPIAAVPTTAGTGSEVTPVAVVSAPGRRLKVGVSSPLLVPRLALCDPELTLSCPPTVTAHAGMDALVHAIEAYLAPTRPPQWETTPGDVFRGRSGFTAAFALPAIANIGAALERSVADGGDMEARERMLFASLCAGIAFGHAGTAGAHALQYAVGAATGTPHGLGVGLLAPFVLANVRPAAVGALRDVAIALGAAVTADDPERAAEAAIAELRRLALAVGIPASLRELGLDGPSLPQLADDAVTITRLLRNSPRELDRAALLEILEAAWSVP